MNTTELIDFTENNLKSYLGSKALRLMGMYLLVVFRFFLVVDFRFLVVFLCLETEPTEMHQSLKVEKYILSKPTTYFSNSTQLPKELTCKIVL